MSRRIEERRNMKILVLFNNININANKGDWKLTKRPWRRPEITCDCSQKRGHWTQCSNVNMKSNSFGHVEPIVPNKSGCSHKWNYTSVLLPSDDVQLLDAAAAAHLSHRPQTGLGTEPATLGENIEYICLLSSRRSSLISQYRVKRMIQRVVA